jgi:hypothetical protein
MSQLSTYLSLQKIVPGDLNRDGIFNALLEDYDRRMGNNPLCILTHGAHQSIPNVNETALAFNTEYADTDGMHDTVTANTRIYVRTPGRYFVGGMLDWAPSTAGYVRVVQCKHFNSAGVLQGVFAYGSTPPIGGGNGSRCYTAAPTQVVVPAGDWFELHAFQDAGGALSCQATSVAYGSAYKFAPVFFAYKIG